MLPDFLTVYWVLVNMPLASETHNLQIVNPKLAKEWHPTKNGTLKTTGVAPGSSKKAWWICEKNHEWQATVYSRSNGRGCPYCSGKKVCKDNCLQTINPSLAKEWHPFKNGDLTPNNVTPNSNKKVWWICEKGHEWQATVNNKSNSKGCPYCSGTKVCEDNCLQTINPSLAKEWHPFKNGNLTPNNVTSNAANKVWWICEKGHEWHATVYNRSRGMRCSLCYSKK
jgi:hypothetical protein